MVIANPPLAEPVIDPGGVTIKPPFEMGVANLECFVTIRFSLARQAVYSYLWGVVMLFMISAPVAVRCFMEQKFLCSCCYIVFSLFVPALACFLGECSKSRRAFETVYLLICFLLLNMPSALFQGYVLAVMVIGTVVLMPVTLMKRLHL